MPQSSISLYDHSDSQLVCWFPMRVAYNKAMDVKEELDKNKELQDIEYFLPLTDKIKSRKKDSSTVELGPLISSLIFLRSTKERLTALKQENSKMNLLRFIMFVPYSERLDDMASKGSEHRRIIVIPDHQMNAFRIAVDKYINHITLIPYKELAHNIGHRIRIIDGPLKDHEGVLRRHKGNKHVFIELTDLISAEIDYVPKRMYQLLD